MKNLGEINIDEVISIHRILINEFGGIHGVRDYGMLESAIIRPYQKFENKALYVSPVEKAAAIFESLINNHTFIDGNKRIAYVMMRKILMQNGFDLNASLEEKFDFVIDAASGNLNYDQIKKWIESKLFAREE